MSARDREMGPPEAGSGAMGQESADRRLWIRQALAVCRLELRRNFLAFRSLPLYVLAGLPILLFMGLNLIPTGRSDPFRDPGFAPMLYAGVYQSFMLRFVFFFGCVITFMNLFRGDMLDRSLHYYFLSPVRRDVLVVGKYLSGLATTGLLFCATTLASYLLLALRQGATPGASRFSSGQGASQLAAYLFVTFLACVGYGALFLLMGLYFRNPMIPAVVILGWESIIFLLPPLLKKFSVVYYLQSLCPVQLTSGPIEILAEPSPPSIAVPGVILVTAGLLFLAGLRIRRMEISYASE
jgi:ABC-type transport system involved in multi-copper enzyme maturation permease subunit